MSGQRHPARRPAPASAAAGRPARPICSSAGSGGGRSCPPRRPRPPRAPRPDRALDASSTVTVEDGQPWQLPSSRSRATPSCRRRGTAPRRRASPGRAGPGPAPRWIRSSTSERVQVVQQQQALDQRVLGQRGQHAAPASPLRERRRRSCSSPSPYSPTQQADQFLGAPRRSRRPAAPRSEPRAAPRPAPRSGTPVIASRSCRRPGRPDRSGGQGNRHRRVHLVQDLAACRGTCARRTAGTGRSCARPA